MLTYAAMGGFVTLLCLYAAYTQGFRQKRPLGVLAFIGLAGLCAFLTYGAAQRVMRGDPVDLIWYPIPCGVRGIQTC